MAVREPPLTVAQKQDELARKLVELIGAFNALEAQLNANPATTLVTGLSLRANVDGARTTPRVMMGPAANVGATFRTYTFRGKVTTGPITVPGLLVGDVVLTLQGIQPLHIVGSAASSYEATISIAGQIQQVDGTDLSGVDYIVLVERRSPTGATDERPLYVVP